MTTSTSDDTLFADLTSGVWERYSRAHGALGTLMASLPAREARTRGTALATRAIGHPSKDLRGSVCAHVLPRIAAAGRFPAKLDSLVALASPYENSVRTILAAIPPERRRPIFAREISAATPDEVVRIAGVHLECAPEAVHAVLDYFVKLGQPREGLNALAFMRERNPHIREIAAAFESQLGKPPFTFVDPQVVTVKDVAKLDPVSLEQWRYAASSYCGTKIRTPEHFIKRLAKDELSEADGEMRRWRVLRGKTHELDLWVVWVENGAFFRAGTSSPVPLHIVQDLYEPLDATNETRQLAADLRASAPKSLWPRARKPRASRSKGKSAR